MKQKQKYWSIRFRFLYFIILVIPAELLSQSYPDSAACNAVIRNLAQKAEISVKSSNHHFEQIKFSAGNVQQCVSILKSNRKQKILIFWQKDANNKWTEISYIIASQFKFIDIDNNGIIEIECIDKQRNKNRRDKSYRLISLAAGKQTEMYSYRQYEYYNVTYIQSNIAPDSVFAVNHTISIKDIDWDGKPELTDFIEIKYRKLPCCDHHFEYGIREKKLVLRLINGKFEMY